LELPEVFEDSRDLPEAEGRRTLLLAAIDGLREQATADTDGFARMVREAFEVPARRWRR
jgi:hypothetical protein